MQTAEHHRAALPPLRGGEQEGGDLTLLQAAHTCYNMLQVASLQARISELEQSLQQAEERHKKDSAELKDQNRSRL